MVWLKRMALGLAALLVLAGVLAAGYVFKSFPVLDGKLAVPGLVEPVRIERDPSDVTHVKASTPPDVWFGLGYVHAQERSWQLELNRRLMQGELSEVFGASTLDTDKLLRTLGLMRAAQVQWNALPDEARVPLKAYADGINAFHATSTQALPPEFHVLGVTPGVWTPQNSVGWSLMMALDMGGNWGTEFARLSVAQRMPTDRMWQLMAPYGRELPVSKVDFSRLYADLGVYRTGAINAIKNVASNHYGTGAYTHFDSNNLKNELFWAEEFANQLGNVDGKGSNSWALAGSRTVSGKPLLANDPHLALSAPAIWYFARLQAPGIDVIGATLPGLPFVVLGRTDRAAWGFTNTGPDVQDLYLEQINPDRPTQYRVPDVAGQIAWADFKTRQEVIKVKKQGDVILTVRETRHGPVLSDVHKSHADLLDLDKYVLSLRWAALEADNQTVLAGVRVNRAKSVADLKAAYADFHSPMSSVVMADVDGQIALKTAGRVPLRRADNDIMGLAPSPGWDARYDWAGWIPVAETPHDDGGTGWLASANQNVSPPGYPHFMGQDFTLPFRYGRIQELLVTTPRHDLASMKKMQGDQLSKATLKLLAVLLKAQPTHPLGAQALARLREFDAVMRADAPAPLIFAAWADEITRALVQPKLGPDLFKALYGKRHFRFTVEQVLLGSDPWWCGPQSCDEQVNAALDRALSRLQAEHGSDLGQWRWGEAHNALSAHRPFSNVALLAPFFEVRAPTGGDPFTINVGQYWPVEGRMPFANRHAASMRTLFDLADLENSLFIYQTGQSGLVFSSRYRDMALPWSQLQYRPLQLSPERMVHSLTITPATP